MEGLSTASGDAASTNPLLIRHPDPMTSTKTYVALALAFAAPALIAFGPKADSIVFAPKDGTSVTKTFVQEMEFSLDDMGMLMNGEDSPMMPSMEMDMTVVQTVSVSDSYGPMKGRRPAKLSRTFDAISSEIGMEMTVDVMGQVNDEQVDGNGSSPLEGLTVDFTWDEDAGGYTRTFADDSDGNEEHLVGLVEDMDLRALLPTDEVSEGDEWDIELPGLVDILAPGGNLVVDVEMGGEAAGAGPDPAMMSNVREMIGDILEGTATGKFAGTREVDGINVAVIEISIEIDTSNDMSEFFQEMVGDQIPAEVDMSLDRADVEFALETSGELLWNIGAGHVYSLNLEGDSAVSMAMEMAIDAQGQSMVMEMSMTMSGTIKNTVSVE